MTITVAQDTCIRTNQTGAGTASDGETYTQPIGASVLSIVSNRLQVTGPTTGSNSILLGSGVLANGDFTGRFSLSSAANDFAGFVFRYVDSSDYYRLEIHNNIIRISRFHSGQTILTPTTTTVALTNATNYQMHLNLNGSTFSCNVWPDGQAEPSGWKLQVTDTTLASGQYGLFAYVSSASDIVLFDSFAVKTTPTVYYVAPNGNDSNAGFPSSPFATLQHAFNVVFPGDSIRAVAGTYTQANAVQLTSNASGTPLARILYLSDTPRGALIRSRGTPYVWLNTGNYVDMMGFDISATDTATRIGIYNNASFNSVQNCKIHDLAAIGSGNNGGAGILHGNIASSDNDTIGNFTYNIGTLSDPSANFVHGIYHACLRGHLWNNISFGNSGWGLALWHAATNITIANNLLFTNGLGGIVVGAGDAPGGVTCDNCIVSNNISIYNALGIHETGLTGTHNSYLNNCVWNNTTSGITLQSGSPVNTVNADPLFTNYTASSSGDYTLKSSSPCVSAGTSTGAPTTDYSNAFRSLKAAIDIGPYLFYHSALFPATSRRTGVFPTIARRTGVFPTTNRRGS